MGNIWFFRPLCSHVAGLDSDTWSREVRFPGRRQHRYPSIQVNLSSPESAVWTASERLKQSLLACLGKAVSFWGFFCLFSGVHVQYLSVFIRTEAQQWESLTPESREHLIRSLSTMASDSRPELQERAFVLKKTLESLD